MLNLNISFKISIVTDIMAVCRTVDDITVIHDGTDDSRKRKKVN